MTIKKRTRFEIFKRDSFTCQYCGRSAPDVILQADHINPVSKGGDDDITNLITSCRDCNLGKTNIKLDDNTVIKKRKSQLDELQERREQLDMLFKWNKSLIDIDNETIENLSEFFQELVGSGSVNETGKKMIEKWMKKYSVSEIIEAMKCSISEYNDDPPKAFEYIPKICHIKRVEKEKPYIRDVFYIRGVVRNTFSYCNEWKARELLEKAFVQGWSKDELKEFTLERRNWSDWRYFMEGLTDEQK